MLTTWNGLNCFLVRASSIRCCRSNYFQRHLVEQNFGRHLHLLEATMDCTWVVVEEDVVPGFEYGMVA